MIETRAFLGSRDITALLAREHIVSFCRDGPVTKIDATHFSVHRIAFVPSHELRVGFIQNNE